MTDLTPLFNQCVEIVQSEINHGSKKNEPTKLPDYLITDTFHKECKEFYNHLVGLNILLGEIKSSYLSVNYDDPYNKKKTLSIEDKNKLDEDFQIKLQALYEKLKVLQYYENQRQSKFTTKESWITNIFGNEEKDIKEVYYLSLISHRTQMLKFLNETINNTNKNFEHLQRKRTQREKQLNLLNFQNLEEDINIDNINDNITDFNDTDIDGVVHNSTGLDLDAEGSSGGVTLTQEQIQDLESENKQFLNLKSNQLKKVENLQTSMVDIINLQNEITSHIETQSNQIMNLIDNQDQINVDLKQGNRNLTKTTSRNKRGSNIIIFTCIIMGVLLLFIDYISF